MKRKNSITDSLKKKGKELDLDAMKKKVQELHDKEKKPEKEPIIRLSVDAPESVYLALKGKILRERTTIKNHVLKLIKKDLGMD